MSSDPNEDCRRLADLLDRVLVRAENGHVVQKMLTSLADSSSGDELKKCLARAQGLVGMVNSTSPGDPLRDRAYREIIELKHSLRG